MLNVLRISSRMWINKIHTIVHGCMMETGTRKSNNAIVCPTLIRYNSRIRPYFVMLERIRSKVATDLSGTVNIELSPDSRHIPPKTHC